jgi:hypothetical protein
MHPDYEALQAKHAAAENILRHVAEHLADAAFGTSLERLRTEVYHYFCMPLPVWADLFTSELEARNG